MGADKNTCKITNNGISMLRFKDEHFIEELKKYEYSLLTIIGRATLNEFAGNITPQIIIENYVIEDNLKGF